MVYDSEHDDFCEVVHTCEKCWNDHKRLLRFDDLPKSWTLNTCGVCGIQKPGEYMFIFYHIPRQRNCLVCNDCFGNGDEEISNRYFDLVKPLGISHEDVDE